MKKSYALLTGLFLCLFLADSFGQTKPLLPQCTVYSVNPLELDAGSGAGQVYPTISVTTQNGCTNYTVDNAYNWMSYVKNGLNVTVYVTNNTGYTVKAGCLVIGTYCVYVVQACSLKPGNAGSITGSSSVCNGQTGVTYSVPAITYATGYVWSLPSGASITSGANTNSIIVSFNNDAVSGNISVYGINGCTVGQGGVSPNFAVTVSPLPQPPLNVRSSKTVVCHNTGGTMTLSADILYGSTLRWFKDACNGTPLGTGNNLQVSVPTSTSAYYAWTENSCGHSTCNSVLVTVYPTPSVTISQNWDPAFYGQDGVELLSHVTGGGDGTPTYSWTGPYGFTSSDVNAIVGVVNEGAILGPYNLTYTSAQGCIGTATWNLHMTTAKKSTFINNPSSENKKNVIIEDFTLYPNPTSGIINISSNQIGNIEVTVYNNLGTKLFTRFNVSKIDLSGFTRGKYFIKLKSNGKEVTRTVILE